MADDRLAMPGDPDLDCMLTGLRLASIVATDSSEHDVEATLTFDTSGAAGYWTDSATGWTVYPDTVKSLDITFGVSLDSGFVHLAAEMTKRLSAWCADGALIAMTSAPGKWTLLRCPGHPAGGEVPIPRSPARRDIAATPESENRP